MTSHTKPWKEKQLEEIKDLLKKYSVIAVADIRMFPSALFQQVRKKLHGQAVVKVSKTRIIRKALQEVSSSSALVDYANKECAIIFTDMNPFELFGFLKKNKGKVSAKVGAIAEEDITVPAGDTGLPPGPALSDLKGAGLKVAVQGPTISIMEDKVVTKAGEPVSEVVAGTLSKLNIKPFKVGLKLVAVLEGAQVFQADVLDIDTEQVFANFVSAHNNAFNLAFNASIFTTETTELLVSTAFSNAKAVALESNFLTSATVGSLLAKANVQASALKGMVKEAPAEEKKEESAEEKKEETTEQPKEEAAKEEVKEEPQEEKAEEKPAEEKKEESQEEAKEEPKEEAPAEEKKEKVAEAKPEDSGEKKEDSA